MSRELTHLNLERVAEGRQHDPVITKEQARELLKLGRQLKRK